MRRWKLAIDYTGSVEGIYAFIYCTKWRSGRVSRMPHSQMKDRATQLPRKYKSGALVTQKRGLCTTCLIFVRQFLLRNTISQKQIYMHYIHNSYKKQKQHLAGLDTMMLKQCTMLKAQRIPVFSSFSQLRTVTNLYCLPQQFQQNQH